MRRTTVLAVAFVAACGFTGYVPPPPPTERLALQTAAPFDRTWDAVIDVFAQRNLAIATIDRSSGLIVASPLALRRTDAITWAACGVWHEGMSGSTVPIIASRAEFNVLVRTQAPGSMVRVSARWVAEAPNATGSTVVCQSRGVWEPSLEESIRAAAEKKAP